MDDGPQIALSETEIEQALIDGHWQYGALIHQTAANDIHAAFGTGPDEACEHVRVARLFGEYASSLETLAAWAIALRARTEPGSFLKKYVGYRNREVDQFYRGVGDHEGDLGDLLALPDAGTLIGIAMARQGDDLAANLDGFESSLTDLYNRLKDAGTRYFNTDRVLVDAYNKTKHGAPMVHLFGAGADGETFEFVLRNPARDLPGEPPYRFSSFTVNQDEADKMLNNVKVMTAAIRELAVITKLVNDSNLLYTT